MFEITFAKAMNFKLQQSKDSEGLWPEIHPDVAKVARARAESGQFDDAIFAAYRTVESAIQDRIASQQIGIALVTEAFSGPTPKIDISDDPRDRAGVVNLFSGALGIIRNDRAHKTKPNIPCETLQVCLWYLGFASLLLYLLSRDKNSFPRIEELRSIGTSEQPMAELRGSNFGNPNMEVYCGEVRAQVVRSTSDSVQIVLPKAFSGNIRLIVEGRPSNEIFYDASHVGSAIANYYEVRNAELPLYSDQTLSEARSGVVLALLAATEGGLSFERAIPTRPGDLAAGQYIAHGPFDFASIIGESWYRDPRTGDIRYAWTSSALYVPQILGRVGQFRLGGISIRPRMIETNRGENRSLRVIGRESDGVATRETDLTSKVTWVSPDPEICFIDGGKLIAKKLGKSKAECRYGQFVDSVEVNISHIERGRKATYFQGPRNIQQIRFDAEDNLYLCNQGPSIFRLERNGNFAEVVSLTQDPGVVLMIDCIAVDRKKNLYANQITKQIALKFEWDGFEYKNPHEMYKNIRGAKKSIAVTEAGTTYIVVMGEVNKGLIVRRDIDGSESAIPVGGTTFLIGIGPEESLYVPIASSSLVLVYSKDGRIVNQIPYGSDNGSATDILVQADGTMYLAFQTGKVLRCSPSGFLWKAEFLPYTFGNPAGLAMDSAGRLFVSDSASGTISVVY